MERIKKKDLMELLMDRNVRDDAVIWWSEIVNALKAYPSRSLWVCCMMDHPLHVLVSYLLS